MNESYSEYAVEVPGGVWSLLGMKKEYEVIFLDGTLEISAIYNKSRRKKKFQCEMKEAAGYYLGKKEDAGLGKITRDFSSRSENCTVCILKIGTEKGWHVVCFEPGEELSEILNRKYPQLRVR